MNICVYGASSKTIDKSYVKAGEHLGRIMVERGHKLVFGGGANGLMGAVARGVYEKGGEIKGVVPKFFNVDGILFENCNELLRPDTMRERKQIMEDSSDGFIITPGGIGTFEEFFEILTLKQLGRHNKPIAIINTNGYYDKMIAFMEHAIDGEFLNSECKLLYEFVETAEEALDYIENYSQEEIHITKLKNI
ncbi:MAG: TIGR00730 family Rossman fold protein [Ruminococcaceae bacterium]|nr:TIGR00730 family Rossman fold protein [Oscillospiraceae bacterium]